MVFTAKASARRVHPLSPIVFRSKLSSTAQRKGMAGRHQSHAWLPDCTRCRIPAEGTHTAKPPRRQCPHTVVAPHPCIARQPQSQCPCERAQTACTHFSVRMGKLAARASASAMQASQPTAMRRSLHQHSASAPRLDKARQAVASHHALSQPHGGGNLHTRGVAGRALTSHQCHPAQCLQSPFLRPRTCLVDGRSRHGAGLAAIPAPGGSKSGEGAARPHKMLRAAGVQDVTPLPVRASDYSTELPWHCIRTALTSSGAANCTCPPPGPQLWLAPPTCRPECG